MSARQSAAATKPSHLSTSEHLQLGVIEALRGADPLRERLLAALQSGTPAVADLAYAVKAIYLLKGRVRFLNPRGEGQHTPFSLMVLALGAAAEQKARYASPRAGLLVGSQCRCTPPAGCGNAHPLNHPPQSAFNSGTTGR